MSDRTPPVWYTYDQLADFLGMERRDVKHLLEQFRLGGMGTFVSRDVVRDLLLAGLEAHNGTVTAVLEKWHSRKSPSRPPIPIVIINAVMERDGWQCRYCGRRVGPSSRTFDHVDAWGSVQCHEVDNIVVACRSCNFTKWKRDLADACMTLLPPPARPARKPYGA